MASPDSRASPNPLIGTAEVGTTTAATTTTTAATASPSPLRVSLSLAMRNVDPHTSGDGRSVVDAAADWLSDAAAMSVELIDAKAALLESSAADHSRATYAAAASKLKIISSNLMALQAKLLRQQIGAGHRATPVQGTSPAVPPPVPP